MREVPIGEAHPAKLVRAHATHHVRTSSGLGDAQLALGARTRDCLQHFHRQLLVHIAFHIVRMHAIPLLHLRTRRREVSATLFASIAVRVGAFATNERCGLCRLGYWFFCWVGRSTVFVLSSVG